MLHRARQGFVAERTACINRIRGLLSEFGIVLPLQAEVVRPEARNHLEDLRGYVNLVIGDQLSKVARRTNGSSSTTTTCARWRATARRRSNSCN